MDAAAWRCPGLGEEDRHHLLALARAAVAAAARSPGAFGAAGSGLPLGAWPSALTRPGASFVTLRREGALRGCIGTLVAVRALAADVLANAQAAATCDPRCPPVTSNELDRLVISVSVLSPLERLPAASEREVCELLRPGRDGLLLEAGAARACYLPAVWAGLGDPREFLAELKHKAGLPRDGWSAWFQVSRFEADEIDSQPDRAW